MRFKFVKEGLVGYTKYGVNLGSIIEDKLAGPTSLYTYTFDGGGTSWISPRDKDFKKQWGTFIPCNFNEYAKQLLWKGNGD